MGIKEKGSLKGVVRPAVNVGNGSVKRSMNNIQGDNNRPDDRQAYNLSYLNMGKRKFLLFVPESGPMDNQLY